MGEANTKTSNVSKYIYEGEFTILNNRGGQLINVNFIRVYALISLVVWHSLCIYLGWGAYLPMIQEQVGDTIITKVYRLFALIFIPDANMPLFTAVSGFVYSYLYYQKEKYRLFRGLVVSKTKRLFIPYCVIGTFVVFTIYDWSFTSILMGEAHHLWFCLMLFWCFIAIYGYQRLSKYVQAIIIPIVFLLQIKHPDIPYCGINRFFAYFPYFIFGVYLPFF